MLLGLVHQLLFGIVARLLGILLAGRFFLLLFGGNFCFLLVELGLNLAHFFVLLRLQVLLHILDFHSANLAVFFLRLLLSRRFLISWFSLKLGERCFAKLFGHIIDHVARLVLMLALDNLEANSFVEPCGTFIWRFNIDFAAEEANLLFFQHVLKMLVHLSSNFKVLELICDNNTVHVDKGRVFIIHLFVVELIIFGVIGQISAECQIERNYLLIITAQIGV